MGLLGERFNDFGHLEILGEGFLGMPCGKMLREG
jgi:hypothetical protein